MAESDLLTIGTLFADKYRIVELLGEGGGGAVYRAVQENMDRHVALKVLSSQLAKHPEMVERFRREAKHVSQLRHPNTITVFDFGFHAGLYYIVMELLVGKTLGRCIHEGGAMPVALAVHIVDQILRSLAEAHERGIVHRDLKPDNIFLMELYGEADFVKVLDFGIAKAIETPEQEQLTAHGSVFGTPSYMSPEQARGMTVTAATDVYAVGLILYEMLTGRVAFTGSTLFAILEMQVNAPLPPLPSAAAHSAVAGLMDRACAKRAEDRFQDATDFLTALRGQGWMSGGFAAIPRPSLPAEEQAIPDTVDPAPRHSAGPTSMVSPLSELPVEPTMYATPPTMMTRKPITDPPQRLGRDDADASTTAPPVAVSVVPPYAPPVAPSVPEEAPLIGREEALEQLEGMLEEVLDGHGSRLVLVAGPKGVGKTRLMAGLFARLRRDAGVVLVRGRQSLDAAPLAGLREVILTLLEDEHDTGTVSSAVWQVVRQGGSPDVVGFMAAFVDASQDAPDVERLSQAALEQVFARLLQVLLAASQSHSLLVWLDDFQEADELTVYFLHTMLNQASLDQHAVGVVLTARSGLVDGHPELVDAILRMGFEAPGRFAHLALGPLDAEATAELASVAGPLEPPLVAQLVSLSRGVPEVVIETLRHGIEGRELAWCGGIWRRDESMTVPQELLAYMRRKIAELMPPDARTVTLFTAVLQWVALLGPDVSVDVLRRVMRDDPRGVEVGALEQVLDHLLSVELVERGVKDGAAVYDLNWPVAREVLLADIDDEVEAARIWTVAGEQLVRGNADGDAAVHRRASACLMEAGRLAGAVEQALFAGREALMVGALARARNDALAAYVMLPEAAWPEDARRFELVAVLGLATLLIGESAVAAPFVALVDGAGLEAIPPHLHGDLLRVLGLLALSQGRWDRALTDLRRAADWYADHSEELACAQVLLELGPVAASLGQPVEAERVRQHLEQLAEDDEDELVGWARLGLGALALAEGDGVAARETLGEAWSRFDETRHDRGLAQTGRLLGDLALAGGDVRQAGDLFERSLASACKVGDLRQLALAQAGLARTMARRGRGREARRHAENAWDVAMKLDVLTVTQAVLESVFEVKGMGGAPEDALTALRDAQRVHRVLMVPADRVRLQTRAVVGLIAAQRYREARSELRTLLQELTPAMSQVLEPDLRTLQNLIAEVDQGEPDVELLKEGVARLRAAPGSPLFLLERFVDAL